MRAPRKMRERAPRAAIAHLRAAGESPALSLHVTSYAYYATCQSALVRGSEMPRAARGVRSTRYSNNKNVVYTEYITAVANEMRRRTHVPPLALRESLFAMIYAPFK